PGVAAGRPVGAGRSGTLVPRGVAGPTPRAFSPGLAGDGGASSPHRAVLWSDRVDPGGLRSRFLRFRAGARAGARYRVLEPGPLPGRSGRPLPEAPIRRSPVDERKPFLAFSRRAAPAWPPQPLDPARLCASGSGVHERLLAVPVRLP